MADLIIKDTGYIRTNNVGTKYDNYSSLTTSITDYTKKLTGKYTVNDGNEIILLSPRVGFNEKPNVYSEPTPTTNGSEISVGSVENATLRITGVYEWKNLSDTALAETFLKNLELLTKSRGYKEVYFNGDTDTQLQFTKALGAVDEDIPDANTTYKHIPVKVTDFQFQIDAGRSLINYTLTLEIIFPHRVNLAGGIA